jgi:hypothetical protein
LLLRKSSNYFIFFIFMFLPTDFNLEAFFIFGIKGFVVVVVYFSQLTSI